MPSAFSALPTIRSGIALYVAISTAESWPFPYLRRATTGKDICFINSSTLTSRTPDRNPRYPVASPALCYECFPTARSGACWQSPSPINLFPRLFHKTCQANIKLHGRMWRATSRWHCIHPDNSSASAAMIKPRSSSRHGSKAQEAWRLRCMTGWRGTSFFQPTASQATR